MPGFFGSNNVSRIAQKVGLVWPPPPPVSVRNLVDLAGRCGRLQRQRERDATSALSGYAMKASDPSRAFGAIIRKALEPLSSGVGLIRMLSALQ